MVGILHLNLLTISKNEEIIPWTYFMGYVVAKGPKITEPNNQLDFQPGKEYVFESIYRHLRDADRINLQSPLMEAAKSICEVKVVFLKIIKSSEV